MKPKYKFNLNQYVFIIGVQGMCIITGRGIMEFSSSGKLPMYQVTGAKNTIIQETALLSVTEWKELNYKMTI